MASEMQIGLALGGGGARGIAHILVCEAFDELGVKPAVIAGTSIGAIVGGAYASGISGLEMRELSIAFYAKRREVLTRLWRSRPVGFTDILRGRLLSAQFNPEMVIEQFVPGTERFAETFDDLEIKLKIVACDFYAWAETVIETGPLIPAIAASIAIPSVFRPTPINGRMQIDGGAFNPLPYDHVSEADLVVACDVAGGPVGEPENCPGRLETIIGAAQISMQAITAEKLKWHQPDILVRPDINGFFVLDFFRTAEILEINKQIKDDLKRRLDHAINSPLLNAVGSLAVVS